MWLYSVGIPLGLLIVPWLAVHLVFATPRSRQLSYRQAAPYLLASTGLWLAALFLPNLPISPDTTTFTMHFTGGVVTSVLFLFACRAYGLKFHYAWQGWLLLFAFVSALGVLNELLEFFLDEFAIMPAPNTDTWWDLLANTLGAFSSLAIWRIISGMRP